MTFQLKYRKTSKRRLAHATKAQLYFRKVSLYLCTMQSLAGSLFEGEAKRKREESGEKREENKESGGDTPFPKRPLYLNPHLGPLKRGTSIYDQAKPGPNEIIHQRLPIFDGTSFFKAQ